MRNRRLGVLAAFLGVCVVGSSALGQSHDEFEAIRRTLEARMQAQMAAMDSGDEDTETLSAGEPAEETPFAPEEIKQLAETYGSLETEEEKAELVAYYSDMGVDLLVVIGLKPDPSAMPLPDAVRALSFARQPAAVLAARSKLGFVDQEMPPPAKTAELAEWLHTRVLAGEWDALGRVFAKIEEAEAVDIYSHILRSTGEGGGSLLPEEVLVLADACPDEMADWQLDVLARLLKGAGESYGTGPFMARITAGTGQFGSDTDAKRKRTVKLLMGAGMVLDAYAFLPPLEEAQAEGDAEAIYAHARYFEDLASSGRMGQAAPELRKRGWDLLGELALNSQVAKEIRTKAMKRAIDQLPIIPPGPATDWLGRVFDDPALGPAALEIVTLQAMNLQTQAAMGGGNAAQTIATMKSAVETLLAKEDLDMAALRVPLRILTTALADAVNAAVQERGQPGGAGGMGSHQTLLLFRAAPDERWLSVLEPSVAIRGYRASIAIATICDETDIALQRLASAVKRYPDAGRELADEFLRLWVSQLNKGSYSSGYDAYSSYFYYGPQRISAAPLTRGRQRRNLERLERVLDLLEGMGVSGRQLPSVTSAFKACHARTEVYDRADIERVFGPVGELPAFTATALSEAMREGLSGDWRSRQAQQGYGMSRSEAEISDLVEEGYALAVELIDRAVEADPDSWRHAIVKAALTYDRVRFKQAQRKEAFAAYNDYRKQAFAAFEAASRQYAQRVTRGQEHDSSGVYLQWFSAVLDVGQPLESGEEAAREEDTNNEQIDRIAASMRELPDDAYERHVAIFARDLISALAAAPPERKPTIVRAGMRIVGDHTAGAALHQLNELYEDLVKNEIRLRLTIDGSDAVGSGLFGLALTLRYTNSVDRETGGFDKYLYEETYVRIGNSYQSVNYQSQIRKNIENALGEHFDVESIGFFEPMTPSREVKEDGQLGWQEKPLAYVLLKASDPSVDRIPQISFDMHFNDQYGPVTLPILSNTPPIDAAGQSPRRPVRNLAVNQTVDLRRLTDSIEDKAVTVEIFAKGEGVIPSLPDLLIGLSDSLPGYSFKESDVEERPYEVVQSSTGQPIYSRVMPSSQSKDYAKADETGVFRLPTERSWLVTLRPTGGSVGSAMKLPTLASGLEGELVTKQYADMDIVEVATPAIQIDPKRSAFAWGLMLVLVLLAAAAAAWYFLRKQVAAPAAEGGFELPGRITPMSTIATLQRIAREGRLTSEADRVEIEKEIAALERACFGPENGEKRPNREGMERILRKWGAATS